MLYMPDHNLCFLHIPKTAGTWVRMSIKCAGINYLEFGREHEHTGWKKARELVPDARFFTLVRHPFAWLRSYWVDRQLKGWGGDLSYGRECRADDFGEFVDAAIRVFPGYLTETYERYTGPLKSPIPVVSRIKVEEIPDGLFDFLRGRESSFPISQVTELPPVNIGAAYPHFREKTEGDSELFARVREAEPLLYEALGYETGPPPRMAIERI